MDEAIETLGDRLRAVRGKLSQSVFATLLDADKNTVGRYERGERQPDADYLLAVRREFDVNLHWLLTGEGEMRPASPTRHEIMEARSAQVAVSGQTAGGRPAAADNKAAGTLDEELMGRVVDGITRVYKEEHVRLPPVDLGRLAARFQADLVEAYDDPDERYVGLKLLLRNLRTDLRAHPAADQSKRQA